VPETCRARPVELLAGAGAWRRLGQSAVFRSRRPRSPRVVKANETGFVDGNGTALSEIARATYKPLAPPPLGHAFAHPDTIVSMPIYQDPMSTFSHVVLVLVSVPLGGLVSTLIAYGLVAAFGSGRGGGDVGNWDALLPVAAAGVVGLIGAPILTYRLLKKRTR
jgi:hypothetical protein